MTHKGRIHSAGNRSLRFTALRQRIAGIEVRAHRDLCSDRDIQMSVAMLNASMAVMTEEDHPKGLT